MAMTIQKRDAGGGWYECIIGTNNTEVVHSERVRILFIKVNKHAFNALDAAGQGALSQFSMFNLNTAPFGSSEVGGTMTIKKTDAGGGWYYAEVGTNDNTGFDAKHTEKRRIIEVKVNKAAFDALHANGQGDINSNLTFGGIDAAAFT